MGSALRRFPNLRRLTIHKPDFSKRDWACVFARLQQLPHLEELDFGGDEMWDSTIRPLANQPSLRRATISLGRLGTDCAETFASLPKLRELIFEGGTIEDGHDRNEPPLPETQSLIRETLPHVKVEFR